MKRYLDTRYFYWLYSKMQPPGMIIFCSCDLNALSYSILDVVYAVGLDRSTLEMICFTCFLRSSYLLTSLMCSFALTTARSFICRNVFLP